MGDSPEQEINTEGGDATVNPPASTEGDPDAANADGEQDAGNEEGEGE